MTAHWGVPDPAAIEGNEAEKRLAFADAYRMLNNRISMWQIQPTGYVVFRKNFRWHADLDFTPCDIAIDANDRLSIQVHPDDAAAQAKGLRHGKDEAWYILDAEPDARIGLGLRRAVSACMTPFHPSAVAPTTWSARTMCVT